MHAYAQTNVQLFNQLRSEGYSKNDRERVREAYEFAIHLFTGLFLPSGKTFIDHLVGTASILVSLHVSTDLVIAGLIHAAYLHGNFGGIRKGISETTRKQVRDVVGAKVEKYVERYERIPWDPKTIPVLHKTVHELNPFDRDVLLMRLVNDFEHNLDLGSFYRENLAWPLYIKRHGPSMVAMAEKLGFPSLSKEMAMVFKDVNLADVALEPRIRTTQDAAYLIVPKSYVERFWVAYLVKPSRLYSVLKEKIRRQLKKYPRIYEVVRSGYRVLRWLSSGPRVILRLPKLFEPICTHIRYELAGFYRTALGHICFVGVTGSCGKTTTKELIGGILDSRYKGRTSKLYNNPDQVAKTLLTLLPWHKFCLHEIGTFEPGIIPRSVKIFRPSVGVVTHIAYDHYESFGTLEAIAAEKATLIEALPADGVAILNADDPRVVAMGKRTKARVITYGLTEEAVLRGEEISCAWPDRLSLTVVYGSDRLRLRTRLVGKHWIHAVLAALATGMALEVPLTDSARVLEGIEPVDGRMRPHVTPDGVTFIDDTWKAPLWTFPASLEFVKMARARRKVVIIGTISDYSGTASENYLAVARKALEVADKVIFVGHPAYPALNANCSEQDHRLLVFERLQELDYFLHYYLRSDDLVLLKSCGDQLNRLVSARSNAIYTGA
jgi:UDP-N-acetylmuramyl pentapeptide synthase